MKFKHLPFILFFLGVVSCKEDRQPVRNDLARYGHHGPVKTLTVQQYQGGNKPNDPNNFISRAYYEFNKNGDISFMQSLTKPNRYKGEPKAYDFTYQFKDGLKSGWKLTSPNSQDSGWGTIEWIDSFQLLETSYNAGGAKDYEQLTRLDSNYFESEVEFKFLRDGSVVSYLLMKNLMDGREHVGVVQQNVLYNITDTTFIEIVEKDKYGNALEVKSKHTNRRPPSYTIKEFTFYE